MGGDKHNPGDWRVGGYVGYGDIDGVRVYSADNYVLAVAIGDVPELNAEANARLIAAAPELLEALNEFPAEGDDSSADRFRDAVVEWFESVARPAIDKAEGRS